jgi:hypothetical protein
LFHSRPIYGHIRFSYYGMTDTRLSPKKDDNALALLYDETRMARRFYLFENLTLPSLIAQTDKGFKTIIMSSDVMPDPFKERLSTIAARLPGAEVIFSSQRTGDRAFRKPMLESLGPKSTGTAVHFRLDDDDALAASYIARLRRLSHTLPTTTHITFPYGIMLFPKKANVAEGTSILHRQMLQSPGLARVNGPGFAKNPFEMQHGSVWERWPLVSDPSFPAYIRTFHYENDTSAKQDKWLDKLRTERNNRRRSSRHAKAVERVLSLHYPFITQVQLDGLVTRSATIASMADLDPLT